MQPTWLSHGVRFTAFVSSTMFLPGTQILAAEGRPTELAPFKVEAEFGVDGLRIQNSQSVLNQHLLEQHGLAQMQDIAGAAPNLFISNSDSRGFGDVLALRGSANSIFFSGPSVALYLDDVPSGSVSSYPSTLLNIETLIVKAGPQGTDYGRNAPAGVIDIKSRLPGGTHQGKVLVDYGSFHARAVQLAFDGPVGAKAGYSASFGYNEREGYLENTFLRRPADDRQAFTGRGAFYVRPDETLQLRFGFLVENIDDDATRLSSLFSPDRFDVSSDLNGTTKIDREQFSFQARKKFSWGSFTSTTAWQDWELDPALTDLDLSPFPAAFSRVQQEEKLWTQEFRFESNPTANKAQWRAGFFYLDSSTEGDALRQFIVPPSAFVPPGFVQTERTLFDLGQKNLAGYANFDHPLSAESILKLGVRFERTESEIDRRKAAPIISVFPVRRMHR
ncbi:MAG: TonB-dependent receptor plug domain-containing protein [Opitutaceae bacterium]